MKAIGVPAADSGFSMDLQEMLGNPKFLDLCLSLCHTYGTIIHKQIKCTCDMKTTMMMADFGDYGSKISTPEDLVNFIDLAAKKLGGTCSDQNILLANFDAC